MIENPYSTEIRYALDLLVLPLQSLQPGSVRIATQSCEMAKAVIRRLCFGPYEFFVESTNIQQQIQNELGIATKVRVEGTAPSDAALFPFSFSQEMQPAGEHFIAVASANAFSYKSLLRPGFVKDTIFRTLKKLRPGYRVSPYAGLFSPWFVVLWALAKLIEPYHSALYFRLEDIAMQRLVNRGPFWRVSYVVIFTGIAANKP